MNRFGSSTAVLLAVVCALSSAAPQDITSSSDGQHFATQEELPQPIGVVSGSSEGAYKREALLPNYPSFRQSTRAEFGHRSDLHRPGYYHDQEQTLTHVPLVRSFQAASYVHDDVPSMIFFNEKREGDALPPLPTFLNSQTATQTERSSVIVPLYFDEHDEHLGLTDVEERVKIYYNGNPDLVPPFQNWKKLDEAKKKQNRLFNYFKTQRANFVISN